MKISLLTFIICIFFYNISYAQKYSNSWKFEIECKDRGNKWWEASYVVDLVDNKFSMSFDKRWGWMKNITFEGEVKKK